MFIFRDGGKIMGGLGLLIRDGDSRLVQVGKRAQLCRFALKPEYQRQGIGAELMKHLIENAREKGRKGLSLTCKDYRVHYYAKFGYKNLGVSASVHGGAVWYDMLLDFEA